jgi:hypothetical protein
MEDTMVKAKRRKRSTTARSAEAKVEAIVTGSRGSDERRGGYHLGHALRKIEGAFSEEEPIVRLLGWRYLAKGFPLPSKCLFAISEALELSGLKADTTKRRGTRTYGGKRGLL